MDEAPTWGLPVEREGYCYTLLRRSDIQILRSFRNAQTDVLRQTEEISAKQQERWFDEVVVPAQHQPRPRHLLVSILDSRDTFIGYGGLTPIAWESRRSEVSFLVDPARVDNAEVYRADMAAFLGFLLEWSFGALGLNRLFAESYAFRDLHIGTLEEAGFTAEGRLRSHVMTSQGLSDSVVHGILAEDRRSR